ncbi:DUF4406 domain-containing protein [Selenomonas sp. oral taxon 892]|jgi:hypothetical protein|uniref:DUF7768 domain-containing protein n=1 Tax=Selenomonas sp. oral taxon 892 TaxID=1321785 RepID=UPI0004127567|nr:DUF4406 domain-containing protein [Selenomonas sp. oral taxon 892]
MFKNIEGYPDPTAGTAMSRVLKEYKQRQRRRFAAKNRRKIYVVSKYAGDVATNKENAVRFCRYVIDRGNMPVASHLLYPQILNDSSPHEREMGLMFGLALLALCDEVWIFTENGEISSGMKREIEEATQLGIPVRQLDLEEI